MLIGKQAVHDLNVSFATEEWKAIREQIHLLLQTIWRLEAASLGGLAAFYVWFFGRAHNAERSVILDQPNWIDLSTALLSTVPVLFACIVLYRLKIEYGILMRLGSYSKALEAFIYHGIMPTPQMKFPFLDGGELKTQLGWQAYLDQNPADEVKLIECEERYHNTFLAAYITVAVTIVISFFVWLGWLIFS